MTTSASTRSAPAKQRATSTNPTDVDAVVARFQEIGEDAANFDNFVRYKQNDAPRSHRIALDLGSRVSITLPASS